MLFSIRAYTFDHDRGGPLLPNPPGNDIVAQIRLISFDSQTSACAYEVPDARASGFDEMMGAFYWVLGPVVPRE